MATKNNEEIKVLTDREKSRDKISIFFGSKDNFTHGLKEVIANGTDEIINNFEDGTVTVELFDDLQTVQVTDTGRGIPIDGVTNGIKNYDLLFRTLFAGTKYDTTEKTTTGTNGVGGTVINYTSSYFLVESWYDGFHHTILFENGGELIGDLVKTQCPKSKHGTQITFRLDDEVYPNITYTAEDVEKIAKSFAVGSNKINVNFKHNGHTQTYHYSSLESYFDEFLENKGTSKQVDTAEVAFDDEGELTKIKLSFATTPEPKQESYLNLTHLSEGGSFNDGVISGFKSFLNKYCKDNKLFTKGTPALTSDDIESSLSFVLVAFSNKVEFTNQTKLSTNKNLYKKIARKHTLQTLEFLEIEDEKNLKKIVNHVLSVQKFNTASQKAKLQLKKKLTEKVDGIGNKVDKLVDCKFHGKDAEIYVAEGNSALGSIVLARDAKYQAVYALRGKFLNCLKTDYPTIFKNIVITDLIKVLGCGVTTDKRNKDLDTFDINNLRYGKIIIATDADSDGANIACLIITMIYRLMPKLIEDRYIYLAQTPLYELKLEDDSVVYYFSESEKDRELPTIKGKYNIARVKGLGELDAPTMAYTAMNSDTRKMIQITVEDTRKMVESIETWMGTNVDGRKQFISENLDKYVV